MNFNHLVLGILFTTLFSNVFTGINPNTREKQDNKTEWRQLFNGKDLTGWKHVGPGSMSVEDGMIRGHGGMGLLYWTGEKFGNCTIRVVFKCATKTVIQEFSFEYPLNLMKNGCRFIMGTKSR